MPDKIEEGKTEKENQAIRDGIAAEVFDEAPIETRSKEEVAEAVEVESEEPEDEWAGVSPALRKTFEAMSNKLKDSDTKLKDFDAMVARLKQTERRIGSIQNKMHEAETKPAPTKEEVEKAASDDEAWNVLKEDFPEWAEAIDSRLAKTNSNIELSKKEIMDSQKAFNASREQSEGKITGLEKMLESTQTSLLDLKHEGWEETIKTPEYLSWIGKQPDEVKQLTTSKFAKDAISVLDKFTNKQNDKSPSEIAAERKQRLKQSVAVDGKKTKPIKTEADMSDAEIRKKIAAEIWEE